MFLSITAKDCTNLTLVGTRQGVLVTVGGVFICPNLKGRLEATVLALPGTLGTGGGVVVEVPQFPRPLTPTLLVETVNPQLVDGVAFEVLVCVYCEWSSLHMGQGLPSLMILLAAFSEMCCPQQSVW